MKSEKKFLVTGPTGATGGETVEQLLEKGHPCASPKLRAHVKSITYKDSV
jgi:hypothetical protein